MSYFSVGSKDDGLAHYVWADNAAHAGRKVEKEYDLALSPQRTVIKAVAAEQIPDGSFVIDEPDLEREARTDGQDQ